MTDEWIEIEGRNQQDAIERACNALNTTKAYLQYEVIGGGGSKIRARKLEMKTGDGQERPRAGTGDEEAGGRALPEERSAEDSDEPYGRGRGGRPPRGRRGAERDEERAPAQEIEPTETGLRAAEFLTEILRHIEERSEVRLRETTETIELDILGNGSGLLIGKHGQTLEALQHLVAKMLTLDPKEGKRLMIDSEGYRERRRESLEALAHKVASRVRREGRAISIDPMSAMDRRILHLALADDPNVMTRSVGEGRNRKVMVCPRYPRRGRSDGGPRRGHGRPDGGAREMSRRRRNGPPPRMHDSFDAPPEPKDLYAEEPDAPRMEEAEAVSGDEAGAENE